MTTDSNTASNRNECLIEAAETGDTEAVSELVKSGAMIECSDLEGLSALHYAALNGHAETVTALIAAGADVNCRDEDGLTPLHSAAVWDNEEMASGLLDAGANISSRENDGKTALEIAEDSGSTAVAALLKGFVRASI